MTEQKCQHPLAKFACRILNFITRLKDNHIYDQAPTFDLLQEESLAFPPVMFEDIKQFSFSPMHMTMRYSCQLFKA